MGIAIAEILGCIKLKRKQLILDIKGYCRVFTPSGNQANEGKLESIFPVREKSGNLAFQSGKSQGIWHFLKQSENFDDTNFFLYFEDITFSWL